MKKILDVMHRDVFMTAHEISKLTGKNYQKILTTLAAMREKGLVENSVLSEGENFWRKTK